MTEAEGQLRIELEQQAAGADPILARLARVALKLNPTPTRSAPPAQPEPTPVAQPEPIVSEVPATLFAVGPAVQSLAQVRTLGSDSAPTPVASKTRLAQMVRELPGAPAFQVAATVRALLKQFRDEGNAVTETTWRKYLDLVRIGLFPAELVAGLVSDACQPGVKKPARHLSQALADEWQRRKNRPPGVPSKMPGGRP